MPGHVRRRGRGWVYVTDLPRADDGKRKLFWSRQFPNQHDAEVALAKHVTELDMGIGTSPSRDTVGEYLATWFASKRDIRDSTWRQYEFLLRRHIIPHLGTIRLAKLDPSHIDRWHATLLQSVSPTTAQMAHVLLSQALSRAVRYGMLARNVCELVDQPKRITKHMRYWSIAEARAFLTTTDDHVLAAWWRIAITTGMRRGEITALAWEDIDLDRRAVAVRQTVTRDKDGGWKIGPVKTDASQRQVRIDERTADMLRRQRTQQKEQRLRAGSRWVDTGLVFTREDGRMLASTYVDEHFARLCEKASVPKIRIHDLRHTAATLMLANGEHAKIVSERLGHSSVAMTMNRYSHVTPDMQADAADRMGRLLEGSG